MTFHSWRTVDSDQTAHGDELVDKVVRLGARAHLSEAQEREAVLLWWLLVSGLPRIRQAPACFALFVGGDGFAAVGPRLHAPPTAEAGAP